MSKATIIAISIAFITLIGFISTLSVWNYTQGKEIAKLKGELANAALFQRLAYGTTRKAKR